MKKISVLIILISLFASCRKCETCTTQYQQADNTGKYVTTSTVVFKQCGSNAIKNTEGVITSTSTINGKTTKLRTITFCSK